MNINSKFPEIHREAFTKAREKLGLSTKDLGGMACLSARQIEQLENGESSSFYGAKNKITAAKKVANLLNLSEEDAFDFEISTPVMTEKEKAESPKAGVAKEVSAKKVEPVPAPSLAIELESKESTQKVESKAIPLAATSTDSKHSSQKKVLLWLSLIAVIIFSVINLRPLFFADKSEEVVVAKEEVIEPAPAEVPATPAESVAAVVAPIAEASDACPAEGVIVRYKPEAPRKPADMVYVQVKSKQIVCVIDASGKTQNKMVEPGAGASFYGKPPFKVLTAGLVQVDVFFQGAKVRLSPNTKTLMLEATELAAAPANPTDAQQR